MSASAGQFSEILSHLIVRYNKALKSSDKVPPMFFALESNGDLETGIGVIEGEFDLGACLNEFQNSLKTKVSTGNMVACGMAFADYDEGCVEALLENNENYCATYKIPVVKSNDGFELAADRVIEEEGAIYVFPFASDA